MKKKLSMLVLVITGLFVVPSLLADEQKYENKYAVVSEPISDQAPIFKKYISEQARQLLNLWRDGLVENVYLNSDEINPKNSDETSVVFFVKAKSENEVHKLLENLPFFKHGVLKYQLYPVGILWLKQFEK